MKLTVLILILFAAAPLVVAGQAPNPNSNPLIQQNATADDTILKDLMERMQKKVVKDGDGIGNVKQAGAALCDICSQPLFRHGEPTFVCVPLDPRTGKPRVLPHINTVPGIVQCPVCAATFTGVLPGNINGRAGRDRDFCVHSIGKMTEHSDVWMCPDCGYSAMIPRDQKAESFALGLDGKPVDEATKKYVREKLSESTKKRMIRVAGLREDQEKLPADLLKFSKYVPQNEIPDWIKYDNALQICEVQKAPHSVLAHLYIEGAHACRREVFSEVSAPALEQELQEALGKAITRMNRYVQSECLAIRRKRGEPLIDPTKAELDARILTQASESLLKMARELSARQRTGVAPGAGDNFFSKVDLFVLNIVHAGALDRQGRLDDADKALTDSLSYVPEKIAVATDNKELEDRVGRQLKLLRGIVQDRQICLRREQEFLFKAARRNMAAIDRNEVKFQPPAFDPKAKNEGLADPGPTAYLIGELLRRASMPEAASAWFYAAERIVERKLEIVNAAEKANPSAPAPVIGLPDSPPPQTPYEIERERLTTLGQWAREQREQSKSTKQADAQTLAVIEKVLAAVGLTPKVEVSAPTVQAAPAPAEGVAKNETAKVEAAVSTGSIKSREQLFKMYYAALTKYHTDKKENPRALQELVTGGYVPAADSCLDENGKLICPETREKLMYLRRWEPGDKTMQVLIPTRTGSKTTDPRTLYADGSVR
jgi:hypothetical protein